MNMVPGRLDKVKYIFPMLILNSSFVIEGFGVRFTGNIIRFAVLLYIAITQFKIFQPKHTKSHMGLFLTISSVFLFLPYSHALMTASAFWIIGAIVWYFAIGCRMIKFPKGSK